MVRFFCTWLGITFFFSGSAQIIYTREFTNKLLAAGAGLNMPKESFYHVIPCEDSKNIFDLCLVSEPDSAELKFVVLDEKAVTKIIFPEIHFMTKVASLATNDDRYWIRTRTPSPQSLQETIHADWAGEMSFIPKSGLTDKKYAKAYSIYRQDYGMLFVILFYNFEYPGFNEHLRSVYFQSNN